MASEEDVVTEIVSSVNMKRDPMSIQIEDESKHSAVMAEKDISYGSYYNDSVYLEVGKKSYKTGDKLSTEQLDSEPVFSNDLQGCCGKSILPIFAGLGLLLSLIILSIWMIFGVLTTFLCFCYFKPSTSSKHYYTSRKYFHKQSKIESCCYGWCCCTRSRKYFGNLRLNLLTTKHERRGICWNIRNFFVGLYQLLEIIICRGFEYGSLWESYGEQFGEFFPMFFGIGCGDHHMSQLVTSADTSATNNGYHSLGYLSNSPSHYKFLHSPLMSLHCPDGSPVHRAIRQGCFEWFYSMTRDSPQFEKQVFNEIGDLYKREFVWNRNELSREKMQHVLNDLFFYYTLGVRLTEKELNYLDILVSSKAGLSFVSGSLPKSLSFILMGHKFSRKFFEIVNVLSYAFYRNKNTTAMQSVFRESRRANVDDWSMIKAMAQFFIPNAMGVVHTAMDTIKFLRLNPEKYVALYNENPQRFISEVLRIRTPLPFVNTILWTESKRIDICEREYIFPALTPFQIQITMANQDSSVFGGDMHNKKYSHEFDPLRPNLDENMTFRGLYKDVICEDVDKRPCRYCPASELVMKKFVPFLVEKFVKFDNSQHSVVKGILNYQLRFDDRRYDYESNKTYNCPTNEEILAKDKKSKILGTPQSNNNDDKLLRQDELEKYHDKLDFHTNFLIKLVCTASDVWNSDFPTSNDIAFPVFNNKELEKELLPFGVGLPTQDEDNPKGLTPLMFLARKLISSPIIDIDDVSAKWKSADEAIAFRNTVFGERLPPPNVDYGELQSDESMSQLAFFSSAALHTKYIGDRSGNESKDSEENDDYSNENDASSMSGKFSTKSQTSVAKDGNYGEFYAPPGTVYINDNTFIGKFKVRKGFVRYGACLYFNSNFELIAIYTCYNDKLTMKPSDYKGYDIERPTMWDYCKWVWKTSLSCVLTLRDHALKTHMVEANAFVVSIRETLPKNHELRKFLKPYVFRTVSINSQAANSLIKENAIFDRLFALKRESFTDFMKYCLLNYKFSLSRDNYCDESTKVKYASDLTEKNFPMPYDLLNLWDITYKYVNSWFDIYYGKENGNDINVVYSNTEKGTEGVYVRNLMENLEKLLGFSRPQLRSDIVNVLTQLIINGCGIHENVGQISDYVINPLWVGVRIREIPAKNNGQVTKDLLCANVQEFAQTLSLTVLTGLKMPKLLQDWSHLLGDNEEHLAIYKVYKAELEELTQSITKKNADKDLRRYPFNNFNPFYLESSVSV